MAYLDYLILLKGVVSMVALAQEVCDLDDFFVINGL
jgi:hypothetical protein